MKHPTPNLAIFVLAKLISSMTYVQLYQKLQTLSPDYQSEVADFIEFLATRKAPEKSTARKIPVFGSAKGQFHMSPDFDAPLDDFADYQ